ncbi:MAG: MFS transporter, partial [Chloroflexia bacterium]
RHAEDPRDAPDPIRATADAADEAETPELRRVLRISVLEGVFAQVYLSLAGLGSVFLTRFAVMLQATPMQFGLFSAIGQLSQLFQLLGAAFTWKRSSRKGAVIGLAAAGRALSGLFGLLPVLLPREQAMWTFLLLYFLATSAGAAAGNGWIAWISDLVPLERRGRFFATRSRYLLAAGLIAGYLFGAWLDLYDPRPGGLAQAIARWIGRPEPSRLPWAFLGLFLFATCSGLLSTFILRKQPERPKEPAHRPFLPAIVAPLRDPNFRRLLAFGLWWMFVVGIGGPFWTPFMLKKLGMSLIEVQAYSTLNALASIIALRPWGSLIDRYGNRTAMRLALVLGGLNPLLWVFFTRQNHAWIYLEAVSSGIMWSGAGIVGTNFVLAIAPKGKEQIYSGLYGALTGLAVMATLFLSGALLPPPVEILGHRLEPEQVLFGIGALARWTTEIPLSWVHEPNARSVQTLFRDAGSRLARIVRKSFP